MYQRIFRGREAIIHLLVIIGTIWLLLGGLLIWIMFEVGYGNWFWHGVLYILGFTILFLATLWFWGWGTKTQLFHYQRQARAGNLVVTSGKLLVGDLLDLCQGKPLLEVEVDPGRYPLDVLLRITPFTNRLSTARGDSPRRANLRFSNQEPDCRKLLAELDVESGMTAFVDEKVWNQHFTKERQVYLGRFSGPGWRELAEKVCQRLELAYVDEGDCAQITKAVDTSVLESIYELLGPERKQQFDYREYTTLGEITEKLAENSIPVYSDADVPMGPDGGNILVIDFRYGNITGLYHGSHLVGLELEKVRPY